MSLRKTLHRVISKASRATSMMRKNRRIQSQRKRALFMEGLESRSLLAAFTPGNLAVYRVGDGKAPLANTGSAVFIDEYTPTGALVQSIPMSTSAGVRLYASGLVPTEGMITLSSDGERLALTGYNGTTPSSPLTSTTATTINRSVALVDGNGSTTAFAFAGNFANSSDPRAAVVEGNKLYVTGGTGGIRYVDLSTLTPDQTGITTTAISTSPSDGRGLTIADGQLYATSGTGGTRIYSVGSGTPTSGVSIAGLPGANTQVSPSQFFFADLSPTVGLNGSSPTKGVDTLYVADEGANALQKYSFNGTDWSSNGIIGVDADNYRGLTGVATGATVTLYAVRKGGTTAAGGGELVKLVDASGHGGAFAGTPTLIASASVGGTNNTAFRGVAFVPTAEVAASPEVNVQGSGQDILDGDANPGPADGTDFGSLVEGESLTHTFTIQNTGGSALTLSNPNSTDPNFTILNFPAGPIAAGESATFDVRFTAASVGAFTSVISFENNDSDENPYDFVVSGTGEANQAPVFGNTGPYSVPENSAAGAAVGTVTATDANANQTLTFSALGSGTGAALFEISASGQITVKSGAVLDLESVSSFSFGVRVTDNGVNAEHADTSVVINLSNVNESPVFPAGVISRSILAGRSNGAVVVGGAISATDPDAGDSVASYEIVGGNGVAPGAFAIDSAGVITVNDATQIAVAGVFNLQVTAVDTFGLASSAKTVSVTVVGNLAPVLDQNVYNFTVDETPPNNTDVGEPITASDPNSEIGDTFTFSIVSGNGTGAGAFKIDPVSGQIRVNDSTQLDREATTGFVLSIRATDSLGLFDTATVNIGIFNTPEAPVFPAGQQFDVIENSANGTTVGTVQATFDAFGAKSFSIVGGNGTGAGAFAIDNAGKITVNDRAQLDYEAVVNHQFVLTIRARDTVFNLLTDQTVIVKLTNVHEGTVLLPGDLLVTGINGDDNDEFTFAPLVDLAPQTEIRFTDAGWLSGGGFRAGEGVIVYVAPAGGIAAGTEIGITKNGASNVVSMSHGAGTAFDETGGAIFGIGVNGDSIIAFQGTVEAPAPLFAVTTNRNTFEATSTNGSTTSLPTGLTLGTTAVAVGAAATDFDNAEYTGPTAGSVPSLLAAVSNSGNWTKSDSRITFTYQNFTFSSPPTDIGLSNQSVAENAAIGTTVGVLSTVDLDLGDTFTYLLVNGDGANDNALFTIDGDVLKAASSFNFEAKPNYSIRVRSTDNGGLFFEKSFVIQVTNVNEAPTFIELSSNSIPENQPLGAEVGVLSTTDEDVGDSFTYTLVSGDGSTDNAKFAIDGSSLKTAEMFNFEAKSSYSVRVRSTDSGGLFTERVFTIGVTNVNDAPTAIALSPNALAENQVSGAVVGDLSTTDEDAGDTFTYSLVSGAGSDDNASFTIVGDEVRAAASFNFEVKNLYSIRVSSVDAGGLAIERILTININDVNETPTAIALSNHSVVEKEPINAVVGNLTTTDPDAGDQFTYTLVAGEGSDNNASFAIDGSVLKTAEVFNFLTKKSYQVRVRSTDSGGLSTEQAFTIAISDVRIGGFDTALAVTYKENAAPLLIASVGTVADVELLNFDGGTLTASLGVSGTSDDRLTVKNVGIKSGQISVDNGNNVYITKKISNVLTQVPIGTFAGGVGTSPLVITFNANAFRAEVQAALRAITFKVESENPSAAPRTASFVITDGDGGISNTVTRTVNVTPVNDKPVVAVTGTLVEYTENGGPMLIDGGVGISDADSADFALGKLIVKFASGAQSTDRFEILDDGLISIDSVAKTVSYADTIFGTYAGTSSLTVTLNANANAAVVQELARHITYRSISDAPTTVTRNVSFSLSDGDGATSLAATADTVKITAVNDIPSLTVTNTTPATYNENAAPLLIASSGVVTDLDATNFDGGTLTVAISTNPRPEDRLAIKDVGTLANQISVDRDAKKIFFTNSVLSIYEIASYSGGVGADPLVIAFNDRALKAEVQATLRAITFEAVSENPSALQRQLSFVLTDGDSGVSGIVYRDIKVVPKNDAALIENLGDTAAWTIGPASALIAESATVSDVDSADFSGGKLTVALTTNRQSADRIVIEEGGDITLDGAKVLYLGVEIGTFTSTTTLTVTFNSSSATSEAVQALLRRVSFRSSSTSTLTRTVNFTLTDGDGGTAAPAQSKSIVPQ